MTLKPNTEVVETPAQADQHSAELKGDKVKVLHDFQRRKLIHSESAMRLIDKRTKIDVRESHPDWHFAWFDDGDLRKMLIEGYEIVDPDWEVESPTAEIKDGRLILNGELTACRYPMELYKEWIALRDAEDNVTAEQSLEEMADQQLREKTEGLVKKGDSRGYGGINIKR